MAGSSNTLHEPRERLRAETVDLHRAIVSLMEELEAMDWYAQRVDATEDAELRAVLAHNLDEEKEHAVMTLEWIRRRDPALDHYLRRYLFQPGPITSHEVEVEGQPEAASTSAVPRGESVAADASGSRIDGSLGIGSLRAPAR